MKETGILFKGHLVREILADRKTVTRRIVKPQPTGFASDGIVSWKFGEKAVSSMLDYCPYGQPGDRLWVRETWAKFGNEDVCYRADGEVDPHEGWRPSIFMPRWASRITLEVVSVRVERLQEINAYDVIAEGIDPAPHRCDCERCGMSSQICPASSGSLIQVFSETWDHINRKRGQWASNPWVWRIQFRRVKS